MSSTGMSLILYLILLISTYIILIYMHLYTPAAGGSYILTVPLSIKDLVYGTWW